MNISLALKHRQLAQHQAEQLARIAQETQDEIFTRPSFATAGGDERKLRGIPAIGRGVPGCIPGTSPHSDRA